MAIPTKPSATVPGSSVTENGGLSSVSSPFFLLFSCISLDSFSRLTCWCIKNGSVGILLIRLTFALIGNCFSANGKTVAVAQ